MFCCYFVKLKLKKKLRLRRPSELNSQNCTQFSDFNSVSAPEVNSQKVKERNKNYLKKMQETNPEKLKELRHNAYIRRKERKLQATQENKNENL